MSAAGNPACPHNSAGGTSSVRTNDGDPCPGVCVLLPDVELSVELLSDDSVRIRITGLLPNETVHAIFGSTTKDRAVETVVSGSADEKGAFEYSERLRALESDREFKDWQIRVVHSRGATCAEISLSEK